MFFMPSIKAQETSTFDSTAVYSIHGIVNEPLNIITGKRGKKRDWEAFRSCFSPEARIEVVVHDTLGNAILRSYSLEQFVRLGMQFYENDGFIEYEIAKVVNEYNSIANVFQSYYAKELDFEEKGINSYHLYHDGKRWWITHLIWTSDRNGIKVPDKYLD